MWEEMGNCLVGGGGGEGDCGEGTQILAHQCVGTDTCPELFSCQTSSSFSCSDAFASEPCTVECHPELGHYVSVGGCLVEDGKKLV